MGSINTVPFKFTRVEASTHISGAKLPYCARCVGRLATGLRRTGKHADERRTFVSE